MRHSSEDNRCLEKLTGNAGLVLLRELDGRLSIFEEVVDSPQDHRAPGLVVLVAVDTPGDLFLHSFFIETIFRVGELYGGDCPIDWTLGPLRETINFSANETTSSEASPQEG